MHRIAIGAFEMFRILQAVWAVWLAGLVILTALISADLMSRVGLYLVAVYLYLPATWGVFQNYRWAWIASLTFLLGYWTLGLFVGIGGIPFWADLRVLWALREHSDISPLGVMYVGIHVLLYVIPPLALLILALLSSQGIIRVLRGQPMPTSDL